MKPNRRLALRRETLSDLTTAELASAGGAAGPVTLTLQAGCGTDDVNAYLEALYWRYSIHQHCSWSCI